jgi:cytochrome c oxidase assembly protein subunit 11
MNTHRLHEAAPLRRDLPVAFLCGGLVAGMVGLSFAAVPLHALICGTSGAGGASPVVKLAPAQTAEHSIAVRHTLSVGPPGELAPERQLIGKPGSSEQGARLWRTEGGDHEHG